MSVQSTPMPIKTGKFKVGDKVRAVSARWGWGAVSEGDVGVIVREDSGGDYKVDFPVQSFWTATPQDLELVSSDKPKPKNVKIDFKALDKLVIEPAAKEEIVSVLKQHDHAKKIFEDWGLGEVIEYGKGMTFLFYGPPGTGKTWGATLIAKALGVETITIGAAEIQTSEPGGANRNIQNAFTAARESGNVLFIDECDSLITTRDSVGMVLGGEINTLLTEIEKFEGVCILATNRIDTLDQALERRISLIIEFPEPTFEMRQEIWRKLIPSKMPLEKEVEFEKLAEHKLTGGQIKNCVLQAALLALASDSKKVALTHFEAAIQRVQKSKSLMGTASQWTTQKIKQDFRKEAA